MVAVIQFPRRTNNCARIPSLSGQEIGKTYLPITEIHFPRSAIICARIPSSFKPIGRQEK